MTGKRWLAYLLVAALVVLGSFVLIAGSTLLGIGPVVVAVRRDPARCYFADESIYDVCKDWLQASPGVQAASLPATQPRYIKGVYISHYALGDDGYVNRMKDLLENTELNAIVMDVKGDRGYIVYATQVPLAKEIGANKQVMISDMAEFLKWFKEHDVYTIARIVTFKDHLLSAAHPEWAVLDSATGGVWKDGEGLGWGDPNRAEVQDYNLALATEAAKLGFDEVQFDYVRFPSDGAVRRATFSRPNTLDNRVSTISGFLAQAKQALAPYNVKVGADTFGYTAWLAQDMGIGQVVEAVAPYLDVLSPMLYPSTFSDGLPNDGGTYRNAIAFPYEIVHKSTRQAVARAKGINPQLEVRPWIQDFPDYAFDERTYTPSEIRAQMDGARDAGGRGWLLWDPAVRYTRAALGSAQPSYPPNALGYLPILRYGEIGRPEKAGQRTPENLRADLQRLLAAGYYPVTMRQMVEGRLSVVPEGKRPVVLTFDGATPGQFRLLADGSIDPDSAVGILKAFHDAHVPDWPLAATFYVAPQTAEPGAAVFGQPESAQAKLAALAHWGLEVGSYTMSGDTLTGKNATETQRELGQSQAALERWLSGRVFSLALPAGALPQDPDLLVKGEHDGLRYAYGAVVGIGEGLAPSPYLPQFNPHRLPRIAATSPELDRWLKIANRPGVSYASAGE
jgi:peptidoglycan/xylan/chitin deacetylase (PgdA/CDA1 family)